MKKSLSLLKLCLLLLPITLFAESRYVTDQFKVTLRSGEGVSHKIVRMLPSGMPLELLSENRTSGYSHVRSEDGKEGYVLTRQLMTVPSARERLAKANKRLSVLEQEPDRLTSELISIQNRHEQLTSEWKKINTSYKQLNDSYTELQKTAADAVRISNERNRLVKDVKQQAEEIESLKRENGSLRSSADQQWFIIGGAVLIIGIILGLILPHLRFQRRKSSWSSL